MNTEFFKNAFSPLFFFFEKKKKKTRSKRIFENFRVRILKKEKLKIKKQQLSEKGRIKSIIFLKIPQHVCKSMQNFQKGRMKNSKHHRSGNVRFTFGKVVFSSSLWKCSLHVWVSCDRFFKKDESKNQKQHCTLVYKAYSDRSGSVMYV